MHFYHWTLPRIKEANRQAGKHWFSPDTLRFFKSRIGETIYQGPGGVYFVSSEVYGPSAPRLYSVREFTPSTKAVNSVHGERFTQTTRARAITLAKKLAAGTEHADLHEWEK